MNAVRRRTSATLRATARPAVAGERRRALGPRCCWALGSLLRCTTPARSRWEPASRPCSIRKEGLELEPDMELAPPPKDGKSYYKGVQSGGPNNGVLTEGRYFYNPYFWSWEISPQFVVPGDKIGIRIALSRRRHARRRRSWPSRARRGSCARSSNRDAILITRMPSRSSCTTR